MSPVATSWERSGHASRQDRRDRLSLFRRRGIEEGRNVGRFAPGERGGRVELGVVLGEQVDHVVAESLEFGGAEVGVQLGHGSSCLVVAVRGSMAEVGAIGHREMSGEGLR